MINELDDAQLLFWDNQYPHFRWDTLNKINNEIATTGHKLSQTKIKPIKSSSTRGGD